MGDGRARWNCSANCGLLKTEHSSGFNRNDHVIIAMLYTRRLKLMQSTAKLKTKVTTFIPLSIRPEHIRSTSDSPTGYNEQKFDCFC